MRRKIRLLGLLVLFVVIGIPVAGFWVSSYLHKPLPLEDTAVVVVPKGASFSGVLASMRRDGLLGDPGEARLRRWGARLYSAFTGLDGRLYVGEYQLAPGDSLLTLLEKIDRGEVMQRSVTLVEGWSFRELRALLDGLDGIAHDTKGLDDSEIMARLGQPEQHPEAGSRRKPISIPVAPPIWICCAAPWSASRVFSTRPGCPGIRICPTTIPTRR